MQHRSESEIPMDQTGEWLPRIARAERLTQATAEFLADSRIKVALQGAATHLAANPRVAETYLGGRAAAQ